MIRTDLVGAAAVLQNASFGFVLDSHLSASSPPPLLSVILLPIGWIEDTCLVRSVWQRDQGMLSEYLMGTAERERSRTSFPSLRLEHRCHVLFVL